MKVPSRSFALADGLLVAEPRAKPAGIAQMHVIKHPFGVNSVSQGRAWDEEGWSELGVIDVPARTALLANILGLRHGTHECSVPELRGAPRSGSARDVGCESCPAPLAEACAAVTGQTVGARYFAVLEEVLAAASGPGAKTVPKSLLGARLIGALRNVGNLGDLVVGYAGLDGRNRRSIIVRLNRGDGVRAEFFFEEPDQLSWRTLYRDPGAVRTPGGRVQFLMDAPPQAGAKMPLSELCLVSRLFWEKP